jgi:hypothetical protein
MKHIPEEGYFQTSSDQLRRSQEPRRLKFELPSSARMLGDIGSNLSPGIDVVCVYSVCVVLCAGRDNATGSNRQS